MFQWGWAIMKRHPTRALWACGLALLAGTFIHLQLTTTLFERAHDAFYEAPDPSIAPMVSFGQTADMTLFALAGDGIGLLSGFVLTMWAAWRTCRGNG